MTATKQKSKKTAPESLEIEASVENEINKKGSKKSSAEKSSVTREATEVEAFENDAKAAVKKIKAVKVKVIRDSFSFPEKDYLKISELKSTCLAAGIHVKKGEILRAGLHLLTKLNLDELKHAVEQIEKVQTGRPSSAKI
jgi:hypothetical protein